MKAAGRDNAGRVTCVVDHQVIGTGSSQRMPAGSGRGGASGSGDGGPSPDGSGLRERRWSAVRQALVAIRYSQVRTEDRRSKRPNARQVAWQILADPHLSVLATINADGSARCRWSS